MILFEAATPEPVVEAADPVLTAAHALAEAVAASEAAFSPADVGELVEAMLANHTENCLSEAALRESGVIRDGGQIGWDAGRSEERLATFKKRLGVATSDGELKGVRNAIFSEMRVQINFLGVVLKKQNIAHTQLAPLVLAIAFLGGSVFLGPIGWAFTAASLLSSSIALWFQHKTKQAAAEKIAASEVKGDGTADKIKAYILALRKLAEETKK